MLGLAVAAFSALAATTSLTPFSGATDATPPAPWRVVTAPKIERHTQYRIVVLDGARVLRAEADGSYANLLHPVTGNSASAATLRWRWRVDTLIERADLRRKDGDDAAARVCALFDLPLDRLSTGDRMKLRLARLLFDRDLPAAAICYLWDSNTAQGTWLANAYTDRVQMLVLRQGNAGRWFDELRDLRADFARAFPREAASGVPQLAAMAVSSDADDTQSRALAYFGDITLAAE